MTDPPSILQVIQSIKAAMDIAKGLTTAGASFEKAELKFKIAELAELLVNARMAAIDAEEQIELLEAKIAELQKAEDVREWTPISHGFPRGIPGMLPSRKPPFPPCP